MSDKVNVRNIKKAPQSVRGALGELPYVVTSQLRSSDNLKELGEELNLIRRQCKQANSDGKNIVAKIDKQQLASNKIGLIKISFAGTKTEWEEFYKDLPLAPSSVMRVGKNDIEAVYIINNCSPKLQEKIIEELSKDYEDVQVTAVTDYFIPNFQNHHAKCFKVKQVDFSTEQVTAVEFTNQFGLEIPFKPKTLLSASNSVLPFKKEYLPKLASQFIFEGASTIGCVPDYIAIPFVTMVASLIGHELHAQPTQDKHYICAANVWAIVVGEPGTKKSPASSLVIDLLKEVVEGYESTFNKDKKKVQSKRKVYDIQLKVLTEQVKDLVEEASSEHRPHAKRKLLNHAEKLFQKVIDDKVELVKKRLITSDVTFASLYKMLRDNPNGLLLYVDEIIGLLSKLHRKGNEELKAYLLQCFNGFGVFEVDRATTEHQSSQDAILSVLGTIQPDKLRPFIEKVMSSNEDNDGFFGRFQLIVAPEIVNSSSIEYKPMGNAIHAKVQSFVVALCEHEFFNECAIKDRVVAFSYDAEELYLKWWSEFNRKIEGSGSDILKGHFRKYQSLVPKLALINQVISSYVPSSNEFKEIIEVDITSVKQAIAFTKYLESHAKKLFDPELNITLVDAQRVSEILHTIHGSFVRRDICQRNLSGIRRDTVRAQAALDFLERHHWIKKVRRSRKTQHYVVNPKVLK